MSYIQGDKKPKFEIGTVVIISGIYTGLGDILARTTGVCWEKLCGEFFYDLRDTQLNNWYCSEKFLNIDTDELFFRDGGFQDQIDEKRIRDAEQ